MDHLNELLSKIGLNQSEIVEFTKENWLKMVGIGLIGGTVVYLGKIWYSYRFFKRMGIKTPKIRFITGNYHEIIKNNYSEQLREWTKQYGKTYGFYEGHFPILVTSDLDFIQEVYIKQFSNFMARKQPPIQASDDDPNLNLILSTKGRWKRMRNIINPTFSAVKLKELLPLIKLCTDRLMQEMELNENKEINIKSYLSRFTMDTICNCAFGMDIDCLKNPENLFYVHASGFFDKVTKYKMAILLSLYFYEFKGIFVGLSALIMAVLDTIAPKLTIYANPIFWLRRHISSIIDLRKSSNSAPRKDYVQILLEAQSDTVDKSLDTGNIDFTQNRLEKKMTLNEIKFNLVLFMLAGYDTTSNALSYCSYVLATHPEEQAKLQDEIDAKFGNPVENDQLDFDSLNELEYLDMFIKEVLRMYPLANNAVTRRCMIPCNINGIDIPYNLVIASDILTLHYDPEHWGPTDPNIFYPMRFSPEIKRHPCVYMPFGMGPRNCVGMKFALLEIKLALVKLLSKFDVVKSENTPDLLKIEEGPAIRRPKFGIPVVLRKRKF